MDPEEARALRARVEDLEARCRETERRCRRAQRAWWLCTALLLAFVAALGRGFTGPETLTLRRLVIVGENGRPQITLDGAVPAMSLITPPGVSAGDLPRGYPALWLHDPQGRQRLGLMVTPMMKVTPEGRTAIEGVPALVAKDSREADRVRLGVSGDDSPSLALYSADSTGPKAFLQVPSQESGGLPVLTFTGRKNDVIYRAP